MDEFLNRLLQYAAQHKPEPIVPDGPQAVDVVAGTLRLAIGDKRHVLLVIPLYAEYKRLKSDEDRQTFVEYVLQRHVIDGVPMEQLPVEPLAECEDKLMPLLVSETWVKERSMGLPEGITLPSLTIDGQPGFAHGIGVVAIFDFGEGCAPVTSRHLQVWGRSLEHILPIAITNLRERGDISKPWHTHLPGCASTTWCDGYDATRCLLLADLVMPNAHHAISAAGLDFGSKGEGDLVTIFVTQNQCLATLSCNAVGLCFVGEMVVDVKANHASEFVSSFPFRWAAIGEDKSQHKWIPYQPAGRGEYGIPKTKEECDAILESLPAGKSPVAQTDSSASVTQREAGNACYRRKEWQEALWHYNRALSTAGPSDRIACLANRAAVHLELKHYHDVVADCSAVLAAEPRHSKAWYRRALAHQALHEFDRALADLEQLQLCDSSQSKVAEAQVRKTQQLQREFGLPSDWVAEITDAMRYPKSLDVLPQLLATVVDWKPEKSPDGLPGWMPRAMKDTVATRRAAIHLYAMLRDEACTKLDAGANSAYLTAPGHAPSIDIVRRQEALKELNKLCGDRSIVILALANPLSMAAERSFLVPLQQRTLWQILGCIVAIQEIQGALRAFQRGVEADAEFQNVLQHSDLHF